MTEIILYGIPNCDSVKKARTWLEQNNISYTFHNYKKDGITKKILTDWSKQVGWEILLNKKGTTWKKLDAETQSGITSAKAAVNAMAEYSSMIKRPVITVNGSLEVVGFDIEKLEALKQKL